MANIRQMGKRQVFELKLWGIHDYFSTLEPHIAELKNQLMLKIENAEASLQSESDEEAQEQADSYINSCHEKYVLVESIVERIFYYSVIIQLYTLVELSFIDLCKYYETSTNKKIKHSDLHGKGVEQAKNYLVKVCDFVFEDSDSCFLDELNVIRNIIAHYNGNLDEISNEKQSKKINDIVLRNKEISRNNDGYISISKVYIESCFDKVVKIFRKLYGNIK